MPISAAQANTNRVTITTAPAHRYQPGRAAPDPNFA